MAGRHRSRNDRLVRSLKRARPGPAAPEIRFAERIGRPRAGAPPRPGGARRTSTGAGCRPPPNAVVSTQPGAHPPIRWRLRARPADRREHPRAAPRRSRRRPPRHPLLGAQPGHRPVRAGRARRPITQRSTGQLVIEAQPTESRLRTLMLMPAVTRSPAAGGGCRCATAASAHRQGSVSSRRSVRIRRS